MTFFLKYFRNNLILSLKKIEDYEFADKLSPEERDNICRVIGTFAHAAKRRIQIDQWYNQIVISDIQKAGRILPCLLYTSDAADD